MPLILNLLATVVLAGSAAQPGPPQLVVEGRPPLITAPRPAIISEQVRNRVWRESRAHYDGAGLDTLDYPGPDLDVMEQRVPLAARLARQGRVESAEAAFEEQLLAARRDGASLVAEYELLIAFGLTLQRYDLIPSSVSYLRRAVEAARTAFGSVHEETAWVLTDFGIIVRLLETEAAFREADAALTEANAIRSALYPDTHPGRAAALRFVADTRANPILLQNDTLRMQEVAELYALAAQADPYEGTNHIYQRWAALYARNGRPDLACQVLERAVADEPRQGYYLPEIALNIGMDLEENGWLDEARSVSNAFFGTSYPTSSRCSAGAVASTPVA